MPALRSLFQLALVAIALCPLALASEPGGGSNRKNISFPLSKWSQPLPRLQFLDSNQSDAKDNSTNLYRIRVREESLYVHPDLEAAGMATRMWTFDGKFPGPTIRAEVGKPLRVVFENDLMNSGSNQTGGQNQTGNQTCKHFLPVDLKLANSSLSDDECRIVVHAHTGPVNKTSSGWPDYWVTSDGKLWDGSSGDLEYNWDEKEAPHFGLYHDHTRRLSHLNIYAGLLGGYLSVDKNETENGLPSGDRDVLLIIVDRSFKKDGSLYYPKNLKGINSSNSSSGGGSNNSSSGNEVHMIPEMLADHVLVNGKVWPFMEVNRTAYRFRIVNGANARTFAWSLQSENRTSYSPKIMQIGGDQGLFRQPVNVSQLANDTGIVLGVAERVDVIIDFSDAKPGERIVMVNKAPEPFTMAGEMSQASGQPGDEYDLVQGEDPYKFRHPDSILQFRISDNSNENNDTFQLPTDLPSKFINLTESSANRTRWHVLDEVDIDGRTRHMINYRGFEDSDKTLGFEPQGVFKKDQQGKLDESQVQRASDLPKLGDTEVWWIINPTDAAHPMHLLLPFQVLWRQQFDMDQFSNSGNVSLTGDRRPAEINEVGLKDVVAAWDGYVTAILITFKGYSGDSLFQCHVAEHADYDMMIPFQIQKPDNFTEPLFADLCNSDNDCTEQGTKCTMNLCMANQK